MRHRVSGRKLGMDTEQRRALWRNMTVSLLTHGQIQTTIPKAKSVKPFVEKLITIARKGDLASRRRVLKLIGDPYIVRGDDDVDVKRNRYGELVDAPRLVKKLFEEIAPQYADRPGGYTRIVRLTKYRVGDGSQLCVLQLVRDEDTGPQVGGQRTRRSRANRRTEFAAKLRKGGAKAPAGEEKAAEAQQGDTATATEEPKGEESKGE